MLGRTPTLNEDEEELVKIIIDMENRLYGLMPKDVRKLVFDYCKANNIRNTFNVNSGMAGRDWMAGFLKRHPLLSIRTPEATSMQRALGFNRAKVKKFYDVLNEQLYSCDGQRIPPENIFNVDESGYTICQKPKKIIAQKGKRSVGTLTSAEKGKIVTAVCCMSSTGFFLPPMLIFPRARMRPELTDKAPPGTIGVANPSGWISSELFLDWFRHFLNVVVPKARTQPVLLILDGHATHTKNLELINLARQNNVIIYHFYRTAHTNCSRLICHFSKVLIAIMTVKYNLGYDNTLDVQLVNIK